MPNPPAHPYPGLLIAFEGVDGAGKTTQAKLAREHLASQGHEALYLREPTDDGPFGKKLRAILADPNLPRPSPEEEFELFLRDREDDVQRNIVPALQRGAVVLIDRYYISSMAYQGARGLDPEWIRAENEKIAPAPDLVLLFEIPVNQSLARIEAAGRPGGANQFERESYQERVREIFHDLSYPGLVRIDASGGVDKVTEEVFSVIKRNIADRFGVRG